MKIANVEKNTKIILWYVHEKMKIVFVIILWYIHRKMKIVNVEKQQNSMLIVKN